MVVCTPLQYRIQHGKWGVGGGGVGEGGPRDMKNKGTTMAANFVMTTLNRDREGVGP